MIYHTTPQLNISNTLFDKKQSLSGVSRKPNNKNNTARILTAITKKSTSTSTGKKPATLEHQEPIQTQKEKDLRAKAGDKLVDEFQKTMQKIVDASEFGMWRSVRSLEDIAEHGRFKSQMETSSSSGAFSPYARQKLSREMFGTDTAKAKPEDYEKYGMLVSKDLATSMRDAKTWYGGGQVLFEFDKSKMLDKTTYSVYDTLDHSYKNPVPGLISKTGVSPSGGTYKEYMEEIIRDTKALKSYDAAKIYARHGSDEYLETQYHGELTTKQVKRIGIAKGVTVPKATIAKLTKRGIPVFRVGSDGKMKPYYGD